MKKKKEQKNNPLEEFLKKHRKTCTIFRFSDQDEKKCSCGRNAAQKYYDSITKQIMLLDAEVQSLSSEMEDAW